jgi:hypothetical protein
MTFNTYDKSKNFTGLCWLSSGGRWELGFRQMLFGVRVSMSEKDSPFISLDLCAGADVGFQLEVLRVVMAILLNVNEDVTEQELKSFFPECFVKPIFKDECWEQMKRLADETLTKAS